NNVKAGSTGDDCAEFFADPALPNGSAVLFAGSGSAGLTIDHIAFNSNKDHRTIGSGAKAAGPTFVTSTLTITNSVFRNVPNSYGIGLGLPGIPARGVTFKNNIVTGNGTHNVFGMWADGMTVQECSDSHF